MPRRPVGAVGGISPLNLGGMAGALQIPNVRRPTRGAMGGTAPRGARTRLPPALAAGGARGGKGKAMPTARKKSTKKKAS
jgi:hypothetical protein